MLLKVRTVDPTLPYLASQLARNTLWMRGDDNRDKSEPLLAIPYASVTREGTSSPSSDFSRLLRGRRSRTHNAIHEATGSCLETTREEIVESAVVVEAGGGAKRRWQKGRADGTGPNVSFDSGSFLASFSSSWFHGVVLVHF